jgi:PucR C-terminal helix-turn-helix domain
VWAYGLAPNWPAMTHSAKQARADLIRHLSARFQELELAVLNRVEAISPYDESQDPEYRRGLRAAVPVAISYGLVAIELGDIPPIPAELLAQARLDVRYEVALGDVLKRYVAGRSLFDDFVFEEIEKSPKLAGRWSKTLLRSQAMLFEHLIGAVADEYDREARAMSRAGQTTVTERINRLLAGELLDTSRLEYDFGGHHVGVVAEGEDVTRSIRSLAKAIDARLLLAEPQEDVAWAWIGTRRPVDRGDIGVWVAKHWPEQLRLALGEAGLGLVGWRLTHHQARAAFTHACHGQVRVARYADVALDVSVAQDQLLMASLKAIYLAPLERQRGNGAILRETLSAYFAADRNRASAAAALGVSRQTVAKRLRTVEEALSQSLIDRAPDLELALRVAGASSKVANE